MLKNICHQLSKSIVMINFFQAFIKMLQGGQKYSFRDIGRASRKSVCDGTWASRGVWGLPPQEKFF